MNNFNKILLFTLLFLGYIFHHPTLAQSSAQTWPLTVGIAKRNITPDQEVKNWVTGQPYAFVHDSIYSRALVINDGQQRAVILTWDIVNAGESATDKVRTKIAEATGIPAGNVLVSATHNHSAPWSPVYEGGFRGKEQDSWWAVRYMPPQYDDPHYHQWMEMLIDQSVSAVQAALAQMHPATLWISRSDISQYVQNRRPRNTSWGIAETKLPENFNYKHPEWDPKLLADGSRFGAMDRTMTILSFKATDGSPLATLFQMTAHAVAIYPFLDGISADWPGETIRKLHQKNLGEAIFLQGTAGDINPAQRGEEAVDSMANAISDQIAKGLKYGARLEEAPLTCRSTKIGLPLTATGQEITGLKALDVEIQVLNIGPLAIVTLPGEPMTEIGMAIRAQSPFPQTLVLGYANGSGVYYVGMPGERKYGGYETGEKTNIGNDIAGSLMAQTAIALLEELFEEYHQSKK